jgi:hypothetical protein
LFSFGVAFMSSPASPNTENQHTLFDTDEQNNHNLLPPFYFLLCGYGLLWLSTLIMLISSIYKALNTKISPWHAIPKLGHRSAIALEPAQMVDSSRYSGWSHRIYPYFVILVFFLASSRLLFYSLWGFNSIPWSIWGHVLFEMPSIFLFTCYALLLTFW